MPADAARLLHPRPRAVAAWAALAALAAGCQRDGISHAQVPKEAPQVMAATAAPPGMAGDLPAPGAPAAPLRWTLPKGWKETKGGGQMRYATLTPPVQGKVEVTVVVLPGPAGGELANVNRWRGQIGLPPLDEAALSSARHTQKTKAGEVAVYDFTSEGAAKTRTVAGFTVVQGSTWFLKMTGDAGAVDSARPAFLELIGSLDLD